MKNYRQDAQEGVCMECGERLGNGRPDRKFCSSECKNRYHNREFRTSRASKLRVLSRLNRNYEILSGLLKLGIDSIGREELSLQGFAVDTITYCRPVGYHQVCCCFDILFDIYPGCIKNIRRALPDARDKERKEIHTAEKGRPEGRPISIDSVGGKISR